jgi:DNA polymerase I
MKELYVTNTETIHEENESVIRLYGRDEAGEADSITVEGFEPYFYVLEEVAGDIQPRDHDNFVRYEDTDFVHLKDEHPLKKVVLDDPRGMQSVQELFGVENTGEADIEFTNRLRIDKGIETGVRAPSSRCYVDDLEAIEMEAEPRVVTFDIETDDRGAGFPDPGDARILSIVAHDSYTDEYIGFVDLDGMSIEDALPECAKSGEAPEELDSLEFSPNERRMLIRFASWISDKDADIISGWNSNGFDLPQLIERMDEVGANSDRLGRDGDAYINWRGQPAIHGRTPYDMMGAWEDTKFQNVRSTSLDFAAQTELDDAKIEHQDVGFYDLYETNLRKFLNYNGKDTRLTVEINEATSALAFKTKLRHIIGLDYEQTQNNNQFVEMMIRRKLYAEGLVGPTADPPDEKIDFEGAKVFDAFFGLKSNILGIDLASLYPMTLWMLNASYETKVDPEYTVEKEDGLYAKLEGEEDLVPVSRAPNDVYFRLDVDSIMREVTDDALELKAEYKERRKAADYGTNLWEEMAETYAVAKTIVNSEYGVLGWEQFFLFDKEVAEAVTLMGQAVIKATAEFVNEESIAEVAYGDTDSNYIEFDDEMNQKDCLEAGQAICDHLNNEVYPSLAEDYGMPAEDNRWLIELEMFASRFLQTGSKKQYAYLKTWDEGMDFDETIEGGSFSVSGYHCVKSNFSTLTKETQQAVLEAIVRNKPDSEITQIVFDAVNRIDASDPDWSLIGVPGGLGKKINPRKSQGDEYYTFTDGTPKSAHPRAAWFGNHLLDVEYDKGDKPMRAYVHPTTLSDDAGKTHHVDVIGYQYESDLNPIEEDLKLDVQATQEKTVMNPLEDILSVVNIDVDAAVKNQSQTGLEAFC